MTSSHTDRDRITQIMAEITELLLKKNADYGNSWRIPGILSAGLGVQNGLLVRIDDKLKRLSNLLLTGTFCIEDESPKDTIRDLIGYFVLLLLLLEDRTV